RPSLRGTALRVGRRAASAFHLAPTRPASEREPRCRSFLRPQRSPRLRRSGSLVTGGETRAPLRRCRRAAAAPIAPSSFYAARLSIRRAPVLVRGHACFTTVSE